MVFSSRRGRPKSRKESSDPGTPELRLKHAHGLTAEPIDLVHARGIIGDAEHWSGLHLRWLHTLRLGAPRVTGRYDLQDTAAPATDDPLWRQEREQEYARAVALLRANRCYREVMALAVYNEKPAFLLHGYVTRTAGYPLSCKAALAELSRLREGLQILSAHWRADRPHGGKA